MNTQKTNALSSALKGLIPASAGLQSVDASKVVLKQPAATGVAALRQLIGSLINVASYKHNKDADRLYVYATRQVPTLVLDNLRNSGLNVRSTGSTSFVVDKASKYNVIGLNETYETFVQRLKSVVTNLVPTDIDASFKSDVQHARLYVYMKSNRQQGAKFTALKSTLAYHGQYKIVTSGEYALTVRFDYQASKGAVGIPGYAPNPQVTKGAETVLASSNALVAGLTHDGLFNHIEKLRGQVSDTVLEQMKETLRKSLPKPKWNTANQPFTVTNKLGAPIDLNVYFDLMSKPGAELLPQHVGAGLKIEIGKNQLVVAASLTLFKVFGKSPAMYAVIRTANGYHNHILLNLK